MIVSAFTVLMTQNMMFFNFQPSKRHEKTILFLLCSLFVVSCNSSSGEDEYVRIYEEGVQQIHKAQTQKEISDITYEVSKRIVATNDSLAKEGKEGMESTRRVLDAQTRFFQNVEEKARLLGPEREQTPNVQIN